MKDLTTDILGRGITSNKVITNCFNYHLKKNKERLEERKMREILESLRVDIGIPADNDTEVDANLYQTINKAILMDKEKNKENMNAENEYLSLKKFGYPSRVNSSRSLLSDERNDLNMSHGKKLFNDFESQIIQNIQTIRRKSSSSENENSRKNSIESNNSTPKISRQSSILKKSPEQSLTPSRKESLNSNNHHSDLSKAQENQASFIDKICHSDDNDDDDIFVSSKKESSNSEKSSRRSSQVTENFRKNNVIDDDALFNDNYGAPDLESGESENDDKFNEMKIQRHKEPFRKKSSDSNESDKRSVETPTPKPRSARINSKEVLNAKDDSDEDDF